MAYLPFPIFPYTSLAPPGHSIMGVTSEIIHGFSVPRLNADSAI